MVNNALYLPMHKNGSTIAMRAFRFLPTYESAKSKGISLFSPRPSKPPYTFMIPQLMDSLVSSVLEDMQHRINALRDENQTLHTALSKVEEAVAFAGEVRLAKMKSKAWTKEDHEGLKTAIQERRIIYQALSSRRKEVEEEMEYVSSGRWKLVEGSIRDVSEESEENEKMGSIYVGIDNDNDNGDENDNDNDTLVGSQRDSNSTLVSSAAADELRELRKSM
jgi:hypothetical protein